MGEIPLHAWKLNFKLTIYKLTLAYACGCVYSVIHIDMHALLCNAPQLPTSYFSLFGFEGKVWRRIIIVN